MTMSAGQTDTVEPPRPTMAEIRQLSERHRAQRDEQLERKPLRMRYDAFPGLERPAGRPSWPPPAPATTLDVGELYTVEAADLDADALRAGIVGHGCLKVNGLFSAERIEWFTDAIDRTFDACA